jgi:hypothetical protein
MGDVFLGVQMLRQFQAGHGQIGGRHLGLGKLQGKRPGAFAKATTHIQDALRFQESTDLSGEPVVQIEMFVQRGGGACTTLINKACQAVAHQAAWVLMHIK